MRSAVQISALFGALLVCASTVHAQSLDEIIAKNLTAKGGVEKIATTSAVKMIGRTTPEGTQPGMPVRTTTYARRPNLMRQEAEVGGQKMVTIFDGTNLWLERPGVPAQQMPPGPQLDARKQQAEFDTIFMTYKTQGHKIDLVSTDKSGAKMLHHLRVTRKDGSVQHYYLDAETGLEAKVVIAMENGQQVETRMEDYRQIDGRMVPFKMTQYANGTRVAETLLESVEFNPPLDDALFKPAAKK